MNIEAFFIPLMAGVGGGLIGAFLVRTKRPDWIKEVLETRKGDQIAFDALRGMVTDQQNKVGQAYQVFGLWAHHFGNGTKPSDEEEEMVLDYFGIEENYDPNFLHKAPKK